MERIEHSTSLIDLAGGSENMLNKMKQAYNDGKFQWALELADACIDTNNCVSNAKVKCLELFTHTPIFSGDNALFTSKGAICVCVVAKPNYINIKKPLL